VENCTTFTGTEKLVRMESNQNFALQLLEQLQVMKTFSSRKNKNQIKFWIQASGLLVRNVVNHFQAEHFVNKVKSIIYSITEVLGNQALTRRLLVRILQHGNNP